MLSRLCKGNKKAFFSPKIELTFVQGLFRPKINCYCSLYFSCLFLLSAKTSKRGDLINRKIRVPGSESNKIGKFMSNQKHATPVKTSLKISSLEKFKNLQKVLAIRRNSIFRQYFTRSL